ncbi:hypothetical protein ACNOYE_22295 [Nannocystaceae bacterium ST9]
MRLWSDERGIVLRRATCLPSSSRAESWLQNLLRHEPMRRLQPEHRQPSLPRYFDRRDVGALLAEEVASASDRAQPWRDWADWLWRCGDPRGTRIELGEALTAAIGTAREAVLRREIAELERAHGWADQLATLVETSAAAQRSGEARPQLRLEHGQLIGFTGAVVFGREFVHQYSPTPWLSALAELQTCLHDRLSLDRLRDALSCGRLRGLVSLTLELDHLIGPDESGELIDLIHRHSPRLRKLVVRAREGGAGLVVGEPLMLALQQLLARQREPVHGIAITELELDLATPDDWPPARVDELCAALGRSELGRLRLSAPWWPDTLTRWIASAGFDRRLSECRLIERRPVAAPRAAVAVAVGQVNVVTPQLGALEPASVAVWADALLAQGDSLGELALLLASERDDPVARERIAVLRAEQTSRLSGGRPELVRLRWRGPLLERVEVLGDLGVCPIGILERVLVSPAAARLAELRVTGHSAWSALQGATDRLRALRRLEIDGHAPLARVLEAMPELTELRVGTPGASALPNLAHTTLHELELVVPSEWTTRECTRLLARLGAETLPSLRRLTLDFEPGRRGRPLTFDRLELARGARLRILGQLRHCEHDELRRWSRAHRESWVDVGDQVVIGDQRLALRIHGGRWQEERVTL